MVSNCVQHKNAFGNLEKIWGKKLEIWGKFQNLVNCLVEWYSVWVVCDNFG